MNSFIRKYSANTLVVSVLLLILAILLIVKPVTALRAVIMFLGCIVVLDGVIHIVSYVSSTPEFKAMSFELIQGILGLVFGFGAIFNPDVVVSFLPFIVGIWIICEGIIKFQFAFNIKSAQIGNWMLLLLLSIATVVFGFIVIFNPFGTAIAITALAGIFLLISEIINIIEAIYVIVKFK